MDNVGQWKKDPLPKFTSLLVVAIAYLASQYFLSNNSHIADIKKGYDQTILAYKEKARADSTQNSRLYSALIKAMGTVKEIDKVLK